MKEDFIVISFSVELLLLVILLIRQWVRSKKK